MQHRAIRRWLFRIVLLLVATLATPAQLRGQAPDEKPVTFEVATIKENSSRENNSILRRPPGGRVDATNVPLRFLITYAYALSQQTEIIGGPEWMTSVGYDVVAKLEGNPKVVPPGSGVDPARLAMRTLLADRFKLQFHREAKQVDVYELVLAKPGVVGPALKPSTQDCAAAAEASRRNNGVLPPGAPFCGFSGGPGRIKFGGLPSSQIAAALMNYAGRAVVDRTGLTGSWEFELTFAPERSPGSADVDTPAPSDAPSFFTALQEQLGLKLESRKGSVDVLVIDHVERPTPD